MSKPVESSTLRTERVRWGFQLGGLLVEWWVQEWVKGIGGRKLRQHKNPNFEARELNKDLESKVCHANKLELDSLSREKSSKI